ncbi:Hypothetical predicted protein [Pelobates cultripes]|uniref:Uncharacterized protein n=1 Tax=Pelobates cultripes TaxID=61616 RepID=A0AAD1RW54_PELCU|nr:Hypothetical predicted protein [Pelobates cultripes]
MERGELDPFPPTQPAAEHTPNKWPVIPTATIPTKNHQPNKTPPPTHNTKHDHYRKNVRRATTKEKGHNDLLRGSFERRQTPKA